MISPPRQFGGARGGAVYRDSARKRLGSECRISSTLRTELAPSSRPRPRLSPRARVAACHVFLVDRTPNMSGRWFGLDEDREFGRGGAGIPPKGRVQRFVVVLWRCLECRNKRRTGQNTTVCLFVRALGGGALFVILSCLSSLKSIVCVPAPDPR